MKLLWELLGFCALFTMMVRYSVRGGAIDGLYFYPREVQDRAIEIGLTDRETMVRKKKEFMPLFLAVMTITLVVIIAVINKTSNFREAYWQALLSLEVMNWYDGIVIDRIWVGFDRFWQLPGTEDLPYVKPWERVLKERIILSVIWLLGAAIVALLAIGLRAVMNIGL
ncbi:MAG: hypothetical protein K6A14_04335 [Erysipelotrichaceae bacterium]|nr:hypothetical protein [Erysipelotrichaceae bacterium]